MFIRQVTTRLTVISGLRLTGKIRRGQPQPEVSRLPQTANYGPPVPDDQLYKVVDAIDEVAKETGKSVPQIALNWLLQRPTVSTLIIGARNEEQLKQNLGAVGWNLTADQVAFNSSPLRRAQPHCTPSLLRWLSARRLILKLLPLPRRLVVLPVDHMRVNLLGRANRPMPQPRGHRRQWNAAGQQMRAVRVSQGVQARALRRFGPPEQQRNAGRPKDP
jgi:hypothetical protein